MTSTPQSRLGRHGRLPARFLQLWVGLILFGVSVAFMIRARLGLGPWDVFHQGLAGRLGISFGWVVIGLSVVVLLVWIPLRQRPGIGTVSNAIAVGLVVDVALRVLPGPSPLLLRGAFLVVGILLNGIATGLYIGAHLGPGPRDGLMTGLAQRGYSIRLARTSIELFVLAVGWLLGGTVGVGTLLYAVSIGSLVHFFLPRLSLATRVPSGCRAKGEDRAPPGWGSPARPRPAPDALTACCSESR